MGVASRGDGRVWRRAAGSSSQTHGGAPTKAPSANASTTSKDFITNIVDQLPFPQWALIAMCVGGGLVLLCIIVCICRCCCCRKKEEKKKKKPGALINGGVGGKGGKGGKVSVHPPTGGIEDSQFRGRLQYSISYDTPNNQLQVEVLKAEDLPAMDRNGKSEPYVVVMVLPDKQNKKETKVKRNDLNPTFNEKFIFRVLPTETANRTLLFVVYDFNRFSKHDIIGEVRLPLASIDLQHPTEEWKLISKSDNDEMESLGDICFSLRYVPTTGKLTVVILEAKNVKAMDSNGLSDPFVKIQLMENGKRIKKKKTTIKKETLDPYYNESFTFDITTDQIHKVQLVISVIDHDKMKKNDMIGKVFVGSEATGGGLRHWNDMLNNARHPIAQWHSLSRPEEVKTALGQR
ncbi:unnamed protein product [Lampetra fluviatilis]